MSCSMLYPKRRARRCPRGKLSWSNRDGVGKKRLSEQSPRSMLGCEVNSGTTSGHHEAEVQNGKMSVADALHCCICLITRLISKYGGCTQLFSSSPSALYLQWAANAFRPSAADSKYNELYLGGRTRTL